MANAVYWKHHIRYMFRDLDYSHMTTVGVVDLSHYHDVRMKSGQIHAEVLSGNMPRPDAFGGAPWPEEWVTLFKRWIDAGHPFDENNVGHPFLTDVLGNP